MIKELKEVVKPNPKVAEAYYGRVLAYLAMSDTKSAQNLLTQQTLHARSAPTYQL